MEIDIPIIQEVFADERQNIRKHLLKRLLLVLFITIVTGAILFFYIWILITSKQYHDATVEISDILDYIDIYVCVNTSILVKHFT